MERAGRIPIIKAAVKWALFVTVLAFVIRALARQFAQIDWQAVDFQPLPVLGAAICLLLVPPVQLLSYRTLLGAYAHAPPLRVMAAVAWVPPMGKYVPGKVASLAGAILMLRKFQIPAAIALSVVLVMDGLAVLTGLIIGSPLLLWAPVRSVVPNGWIWCTIVVIAGAICLYPAVFGVVVNFVLRRLGRQPLERMPDLRHYLLPVVCAFSQWILAGVALWLITRSVADVSPGRIPLFISIAGLGYTISYLMLFAPGGIGPREAIFNAALRLVVVPADVSAIAVVALRIVQTITESTAALVGLIILRKLDRQTSSVG